MNRISQMVEAGEIVFVDSSGGVDGVGTRFFIFLASSHAGGVPLAVVLSTSENEVLLTAAFKTLKVSNVLILYCTDFLKITLYILHIICMCVQDQLPSDAFGSRSNQLGPMVFMTDDCAAEKNALNNTWPNSTLLLCIFHVLQVLKV